MSNTGKLIAARMVMMDTNRVAAQNAERNAADHQERELEQRQDAIEEKLEAARTSAAGSFFAGILTFLAAPFGGVAAGQALQGLAQTQKGLSDLAAGQRQAEASLTELAASQAGQAREDATKRAERARADNDREASTLVQQLSEYTTARRRA